MSAQISEWDGGPRLLNHPNVSPDINILYKIQDPMRKVFPSSFSSSYHDSVFINIISSPSKFFSQLHPHLMAQRPARIHFSHFIVFDFSGSVSCQSSFNFLLQLFLVPRIFLVINSDLWCHALRFEFASSGSSR
jgi:hypothetical protein